MNRTAPISVVIPAFNAQSTLAATLQSVLAQTQAPHEIIVVDDGSDDATASVARDFGDAILLMQQTNQGSAVARQVGTESAVSEYVAYLDADDWWPRETLATFQEILCADFIHFVIADFVRAKPGAEREDYSPKNSSFFPWFRKFLQQHGELSGLSGLIRLPAPKALEALLLGYSYFPSASLLRRESVLQVGGWDHRFRRCQDFDLALRMTRRFPLHFFDQVQAVVGINEGNKEAGPYVIKQSKGDTRVLEAHYYNNRDDSGYRRQVSRAIARKYYSLGNLYRGVGERSKARKAYGASFRWSGKRLKALIRMLTV